MYKKPEYQNGKRFFPNFVMEDLLVIFIFLALFLGIVFLAPELFIEANDVPADPFETPEHIKPEWYFLAAYQSLKLIPSELGAIILQNIAIGIFVLLPFLDRSKETNILKRPVFLSIVLFSILFMVFLTIWGKFS